MLRPRIIPTLLIHKGGLVKTVKFVEPKYVGDPINAVKIFNEKEADELIVLDIDATANKAEPNYNLITKLAAECRMPLCYGGGITDAEQAYRIISSGVEKISISAAAIANPSLVTEIAQKVGRQSVVVTLDIRKKKGFLSKGYEITSHNNTVAYKHDPFEFVKSLQDAGIGELVINSVDNDGMMQGYDFELINKISGLVSVPTTFLGGAGSYEDLSALVEKCGIVGVAAGSLFVFKGKYRAVLISYPNSDQKDKIYQGSKLYHI
jgi:cyclase